MDHTSKMWESDREKIIPVSLKKNAVDSNNFLSLSPVKTLKLQNNKTYSDLTRSTPNTLDSLIIFSKEHLGHVINRYLSHDAFIVHMEAELPQAISTKSHLWCLTALSQELDMGKAEKCTT